MAAPFFSFIIGSDNDILKSVKNAAHRLIWLHIPV